MKNYDSVVVGGGVAGLFTAAKLVKEKKSVLLIEQHDKVGGYTSFFNRKRFRFEASLHALNGLTNPKSIEHEIFQEFDLFNKIDLIHLGELCHVVGNGFEANITADVEKSQAELIKLFPDNKDEILKIHEIFLKVSEQIDSFQRLKPIDYLNLPVVLYKHRTLISLLRTTLSDFLNKHTDNDELKKVICAEVMYYHTNPDKYSVVHFAAAKSSFLTGGASHIVGGSYALAVALENYIIENGGDISINSLVEKIDVVDNKVKSVSYKVKREDDTKTVETKSVVSAVAFPNLEHLIGGDNYKKISRRYKNFEHSSSVFTVYFGMKSPVSKLGFSNYSTMYFPDEYQSIHDMQDCVNPTDYGKAVQYLTNYSALNIFPEHGNKPTLCCTIVDYMKNWESLSKEEYKAKKEKHAAEVIESLEKRYPGIKDEIDFVNIASPLTYQRYTLNPGGAIYGYAQNINQIGPLRPKHKTKIKGLYVAGAWATPSGGVMPSAKSGFNASLKVIDFLNKN